MQTNLIKFNTYKLERGGLLVPMYDQFNARVGDQGTPLVIQWTQGTTDTPVDLQKNKLHFYAAGQVGKYLEKLDDDTGYKMSADAASVEYDDKDSAGTQANGLTVAKLPKQFFPQEGIFFGYFGLKDDQGNTYTSVNVWFRVLGGVPIMGAAIPYFSTRFDELMETCQGRVEDALAQLRTEYQAEVQKNEDMSAETRAALSKLADAVGAIQAQIDAGNVVTLNKHNEDFEELSTAIDNRLAKIVYQPEELLNADAIKQKYPNGNGGKGIVIAADTGHKWLYVNNTWQDCGPYQDAGLFYRKGLTNLVGFTLINKDSQLNYGNLYDGNGKKTQDIMIQVPKKYWAYTLATDGSGSWKYTSIENNQTSFDLKPNEYIVADVSNKTTRTITDADIQKAGDDCDFLIVGYNLYGEFFGPWSNSGKSQTERLSQFWQQFVTAYVVINAGDNHSLSVKILSPYFTLYTPYQYNAGKAIADSYTFPENQTNIKIPNYGILALDLSTKSLIVLDYAKINNDLAGNYIVLGYNGNGNLIGPWSVYQDTNKLNSLLGTLYPASGNDVKIESASASLRVSWTNALFERITTEGRKQVFTENAQLKNQTNYIDVPSQQFLTYKVESELLEAHPVDELLQIEEPILVLGRNCGGKLVGSWGQFVATADDSMDIPAYYHDDSYIENKIAAINTNNSFSNGVTFFWCTDVHIPSNQMQSPKLMQYLQKTTGINTAFLGGDIPYAYGSGDDLKKAAVQYQQNFTHSVDHVYGVRGNHDFTIKKSAQEAVAVTESDAFSYNVLDRYNEQPNFHTVPGEMYWYFDNQTQKTRFVGLDSTQQSDTSNTTSWGVTTTVHKDQVSWLINTLQTLPDGYRVIVFEHIPLNQNLQYSTPKLAPLQNILAAFANRTTVSVTVDDETLTADFTKTTGYYVADFSGHTHLDQDNTVGNLLSINTSSDAMYDDDPNYKTHRTPGTINEQCFDVVSVNYDDGTIKCVRIGAGAKQERDFKIPYLNLNK